MREGRGGPIVVREEGPEVLARLEGAAGDETDEGREASRESEVARCF